MERPTGRTGMLTSERPRAAQAPILFPSGQLPVAKLQREGGVDRIEAGNARRSVGEIDLRAGPAGIVDERHAERDRSLLGRHAEDERSGVGLRSAKGGPADAERRDDALHAKSRCQVSMPSLDAKSRCQVSSAKSRVPSLECQVSSAKSRVPSLECQVSSAKSRVPSLECLPPL